jgi:hypothetical protein
MENTKKQLITKINMKGISKLKKADLLRLYTIKELSWNDLRRTARGAGVKARKKVDLQNGLMSNILSEIKEQQEGGKRRRGQRRREAEAERRRQEEEREAQIIDEEPEEEEEEPAPVDINEAVAEKLRERRFVGDDGVIEQNPIIDGYQNKTMPQLGEDEDGMHFHENFRAYIWKAYDELFRDDTITGANIQAIVAYVPATNPNQRVWVMHTEMEALQPNVTPDDLEFPIVTNQTESVIMYIGYRIKPRRRVAREALSEDFLQRLWAFHPSSNLKYHKLTTKSTSLNKLCIYESYMYLQEKLKILYHTEHTKTLKSNKNLIHNCKYCNKRFNHKKRLKKHMKNKCVNYLLNKETEEIQNAVKEGKLIKSLQLLTEKDQSRIIIEFFNMRMKDNEIFGDAPIIVEKGEAKQILEPEEIKKLVGQPCMIYEKNIHVAPSVFRLIHKKDDEERKQFVLRVNRIKGRNNLLEGVYGFHIRKRIDKQGKMRPLCITMYGKNFRKCFYGIDTCVIDFVKYLEKNCKKLYNSKTMTRDRIPYVFIYGFNNSKIDNLLIYNQFHNLDPSTKYCFTNNKVLYIKYNNIRIHDIGQYYNVEDDLYKTSEGFGFKKLVEAKLIYLMAVDFVKNSIGKIKDAHYNYLKCPTISSIALKLYTQVFQDKNLRCSPLDVSAMEKRAYFGGKCAVYKKKYIKNDDTLHYADINSCHASKMKEPMPYVYESKMIYRNLPMSKETIIPYNLYVCDVIYKGNNPQYIPNILQRSQKNIIEVKNAYDVERFGCELIEAIENGCEVIVRKEIMYKPKVIFKDFVDYIYNKRLENANNKAKKAFYKRMLCGLYGKLGQKKYNKSKLFNTMSEMDAKIKMEDLVNYQRIGNKYMAEYKNKTNYEIGRLVRFPAYITALVRCEVSKVMREVGHENIYYSSTDSIFSTTKIPDAFLHDTELGKWKTEKRDILGAVFLAPNTYYIKYEDKDKIKAGGLNKSKLSGQDYENVLDGGNVSIKDDLTFRNFECIQIKQQERTLNTKYNRRKWNENESYPFESLEEYENVNGIKREKPEPKVKKHKQKFILNRKGIKGKYDYFMFDLDE